jgi:hypothetical protein
MESVENISPVYYINFIILSRWMLLRSSCVRTVRAAYLGFYELSAFVVPLTFKFSKRQGSENRGLVTPMFLMLAKDFCIDSKYWHILLTHNMFIFFERTNYDWRIALK